MPPWRCLSAGHFAFASCTRFSPNTRWPAARPQTAHAVAHVDAVDAARALHRPMMHGKDYALALRERHDFRPRLHARPLLREHEFAAGEIFARPRQQKGNLQREHVLAVEILMQAIVVADAVGKQQRRRLQLSGLVTAREIGRVIAWK